MVNGIVSLDLCADIADPLAIDWGKSLAKQLVSEKFAIPIEETYCSKYNNEERQSARSVPVSRIASYRKKE